MDYTEVGGAPLLGVNGSVVKAHGSSNAHAIACAIKQAVDMVNAGVVGEIQKRLAAAAPPETPAGNSARSGRANGRFGID
jgi:glycerol-3-phosphate acyltransferase PlsX